MKLLYGVFLCPWFNWCPPVVHWCPYKCILFMELAVGLPCSFSLIFFVCESSMVLFAVFATTFGSLSCDVPSRFLQKLWNFKVVVFATMINESPSFFHLLRKLSKGSGSFQCFLLFTSAISQLALSSLFPPVQRYLRKIFALLTGS